VITDAYTYGVTRVLDASRLLRRTGVPISLRRLATASIDSVRGILAQD